MREPQDGQERRGLGDGHEKLGQVDGPDSLAGMIAPGD
jgi:hypothetical protein